MASSLPNTWCMYSSEWIDSIYENIKNIKKFQPKGAAQTTPFFYKGNSKNMEILF